MVPNWKITAEYDELTDCWDVTVWLCDDRKHEPAKWRPVCYVQQASLEAHCEVTDRIRQVLRSLGANPRKFAASAAGQDMRGTQYLPFGE